MEGERLCTFLVPKESNLTPTMIQKDLENTNEDVKVAAMKELLKLTANGEQIPKILMTVIRFVVPSRNHLLKKLCLLFWEAVDKYDADGKLLPEMILVW
jgi:coatomer subunit beta